MPSPDKEPRDGPWLLAAGLAVVGSPAAAVAAQRADGWHVWGLVALQLLLTLTAFAIPQALSQRAKRGEASAEQREIEVRTDTRVTINDALDPVLRILVDVSAERSKPAREQLIAQAIPFVLNAASNLIGTDRSRACWFELTDGEPPTLVPKLAAGRSGSPTTTFAPGNPAGDAAVGMVLRGENLLCRDIDDEPPPGWDVTKERDYKTFISISVTSTDTAYGDADARRLGGGSPDQRRSAHDGPDGLSACGRTGSAALTWLVLSRSVGADVYSARHRCGTVGTEGSWT